ncbi:MAG: GGDEF domain-containing protein [Alphaproteobacteria bacterium]|nr:GGDEF domain-containing protein [Alphaproteobacteria bacterium]
MRPKLAAISWGVGVVHYWEMPEHARVLGNRTIELFRQYDIVPTPTNYELWFGYAAAQNAELVRELDKAVAEKKLTDVSYMQDLHGRFFGSGQGSAMDEMGASLQAEVQKFAKVLEGAGQDTATYGKTLNVAASQLGRGDVNQFKVVIEGLVAATRAMEVKHKDLETELKTSSKEMSVLRGRMESVRKESLLDSLTGLANRRCFDERVNEAVREVGAEGGDLCILIGDVDHFKKFNDTWGHATGDQVLRLVAQCFKGNTKGRDTAARYGGEEFVVVLPQTSIDNAITVAEQIRHAVETKKIVKRSTGETLGSITLSLGVARYAPGEPIADTINRADACLYAAKRAGRNRVMSEWTIDATEQKSAS